ncbi:hypothetical protein BV25DRAFT_1803335, partial [Artomyces pyxidatus]
MVVKLRKELLGDYKCPDVCPSDCGEEPRPLTKSETVSLKHYLAWKKSNGTVKAYNLHAQVLRDVLPDTKILSLYSVRKLATELTELYPEKVDMCPYSCIAYTGEYKDLTSCPYIRDGTVCGEPRYKTTKSSSSEKKPRAQMLSLPIMATIRAMYANADTACLMRYRDKCLQQALKVVAEGCSRFSDFPNGKIHEYHYKKLNLFKDPRDVALALSSDGAQLTMKKQSDTWLMLIIILNLPPEVRYKSTGPIVAFTIPGPKPPGHIESFM